MNKAELLEIAKPILFNTNMVRAILDGRKTVTRRVVKHPPNENMPDNHNYCRMPIFTSTKLRTLHYMDVVEQFPFKQTRYFESFAPYDKNDVIYVRETWERLDCSCCEGDDVTGSCFRCPDTNEGCYVYRASHYITGDARWRPSIHMPKEAARIFLKVTDVRVERLRDITEEQAEREGVVSTLGIAARTAFKTLWSSTIKMVDRNKYGWAANPYVWVIEFERLINDG